MSRSLILFVMFAGLIVAATGCLFNQSDQAASTRPECVTLESYSYVIEQVMHVRPGWVPIEQAAEGLRYRWTIKDDSGIHTLSATLTASGCVCGTVASSLFNMGGGKEEIIGLLQGAAVAPVSDLNYTAGWLEPRLILSCGIAYLFRKPYLAETSMQDGTTWTLACSRNTSPEEYDSAYKLTIVTPGCKDLPE